MDTDLGVNAMTLEVTIDETQNIVRFKNTSTRTQDVIAEGLEIINGAVLAKDVFVSNSPMSLIG